MSTNILLLQNSKKHYTKQEKQARLNAEERLSRASIRTTPPDYIKADETAFKYWKQTLKSMKAFKVLDNANIEALGIYCQIMARLELLRKAFTSTYNSSGVIDEDLMKRIEANERLQLQYATKLGLTPEARLRIAKREAEQQTIDEADELYGTA